MKPITEERLDRVYNHIEVWFSHRYARELKISNIINKYEFVSMMNPDATEEECQWMRNDLFAELRLAGAFDVRMSKLVSDENILYFWMRRIDNAHERKLNLINKVSWIVCDSIQV